MPFPLVFKIHLTFRSWKAKILPVTAHQYMKKAHLAYQNLFIATVGCCGNFVYIYRDGKSR